MVLAQRQEETSNTGTAGKMVHQSSEGFWEREMAKISRWTESV